MNGRPVRFYTRPLGLSEPWGLGDPTDDDRCGTYAGARAHRHRYERNCDRCAAAQTAYLHTYREQRKAAGYRILEGRLVPVDSL